MEEFINRGLPGTQRMVDRSVTRHSFVLSQSITLFKNTFKMLIIHGMTSIHILYINMVLTF